MKTPSERLKQIVCFLSGSSILLSSCSSHPLLNEGQDNMTFSEKNFSEDKDEVATPFHLREYLSQEELAIVKSLKALSSDIYSNAALAKEFDRHPETVLHRYGISGMEINEWSTEIQMMRALADDDVVSAIEKRDFKEYIDVLNRKGILKDSQLRQIHKTSSTLSEKLRSFSETASLPEQDQLQESLVFGAFVIAAIYVVVATIAAVEVVGYVHFAVKTKFAGLEKKVRKGSLEKTTSAAIDLFLDKTGTTASIDDRVVQVLKETEQLSPSEVEEVRGVVKLLHEAAEKQ